MQHWVLSVIERWRSSERVTRRPSQGAVSLSYSLRARRSLAADRIDCYSASMPPRKRWVMQMDS